LKPKPLTPARADALLKGQTSVPGNPSRIIWTLAGIGRRIGVGADFVRDTLAKQEGSPVRMLGARYYAFETDLLDFLRNGPP